MLDLETDGRTAPREARAKRSPRRLPKVLVSGGSGFLGQHLVAALCARGHEVRILDRVAPHALAPRVEFVSGSVLDRSAVAAAMDGVGCVYHLAGIAHLWAPRREDFDAVNRRGTEEMLAAARGRRVACFVHCSTEAVLLRPRNPGAAVDESAELGLADMAGPYTRSKYLAEQAAFAAASAGLNVIVVNPTVPIGPGDRNFTPPTAMIAHYLAGGPPFLLDCVLNLVDVRDVAAGMILAAERGRAGERYILGGDNVALNRLVRMLDQRCGRRRFKMSIPGPLAFAAAGACEWIANHITHRAPVATCEGVQLALRSARFDCGKARRELGYRPRALESALADAADWLLGGARPLSAYVLAGQRS